MLVKCHQPCKIISIKLTERACTSADESNCKVHPLHFIQKIKKTEHVKSLPSIMILTRKKCSCPRELLHYYLQVKEERGRVRETERERDHEPLLQQRYPQRKDHYTIRDLYKKKNFAPFTWSKTGYIWDLQLREPNNPADLLFVELQLQMSYLFSHFPFSFFLIFFS